MLLTYTLIKCKLSWPFSDLGWIRKGAFHWKSSSTLNLPQIWRVIVRDNKLWIQFACWAISQKGKMLYLCEKAYHTTIVKTQCQCDVTKNTHLSKGTLTLFKMPKMETQMSLSPPPCRINSMIHLSSPSGLLACLSCPILLLLSVSRMQNHLARIMSARSWLRRPSHAITSVKKILSHVNQFLAK